MTDTGFPRGGNPRGGVPMYYLANFAENCMKMKEIGSRARPYPLLRDPPKDIATTYCPSVNDVKRKITARLTVFRVDDFTVDVTQTNCRPESEPRDRLHNSPMNYLSLHFESQIPLIKLHLISYKNLPCSCLHQ